MKLFCWMQKQIRYLKVTRARRKRIKSRTLDTKSEFNRELYFVFFDSKRHALSYFCKKGYTHCYLMERLEYLWLAHNPTRFGVEIYFPCESDVDLPKKLLEINRSITKIIHVTCKPATKSLLLPIRLLSCVTFTGYLAAIKLPFWCHTPYALSKHILSGKNKDIIFSRELENVDRPQRSETSA